MVTNIHDYITAIFYSLEIQLMMVARVCNRACYSKMSHIIVRHIISPHSGTITLAYIENATKLLDAKV